MHDRSPDAGRDAAIRPDPTTPGFERDVRRMFSHIAQRYEWFDHVATFGNDLVWRPRALWELERFRRGGRTLRVLDVGCGTGELARLVAHRYPEARVQGIDFTTAMLREAVRRERPSGPTGPGYSRGTALRLPFADGTFDLVTNAFLVRNLADLPTAFREMRRVLRPGGGLMILELSEPISPRFARLFHAYFDHMVPFLGAAVDSSGPYRYLPESLRRLPPRSALIERLREAGFRHAEVRTMSGGIVTIYLAATPADGGETP